MIYGILLAAGLGRRISTPKALLTLEGQTFHERGLSAFKATGLEVVVVVNHAVEEVLPTAQEGEHRTLNPNPDETGMFGSVRLGLNLALLKGGTGAILLPVDHPLVTSADIGALHAALVEGAALVIAEHANKEGHPIGLGHALMVEATSDPSLSTLRDLTRRHGARAAHVPVSAGAFEGVNTKEDLERVSNRTFR